MTQEEKNKAQYLLAERLDDCEAQLKDIEPRLYDYLFDVATEERHHNAYEILGALKFLRLLNTYEQDIDAFRDVIYKYEGVWEQREGIWHHVDGGLKHPGDTGPTYYRLQPFQVFVLASMFLMKVWINTEAEVGSRGMLHTERPNPEGYIEDLRRLCTEFTLYTPRKTAKTQLSAFIQFWYFMSGDENAECYCCANASDQAKILFSRSRELIHQMDPREKRIRFTASQVNWKPGQFRSASLTALSAGGKTKDGLYAQLCSADEYGSATYVNGSSDMGKLVSVVESSMGPRREPMTFISTTAGIIQAGPFIDKLENIKQLLKKELDPTAEHTISEDRQSCLLLEPDDWEKTDHDLLLTSKEVRRKVNPMLGIIVQHSFYDDEVAKGRQNPEKMNEVITKLMNVYQVGTVQEWIKPEVIRGLQNDKTIDDYRREDGWVIFTGLDFSQGDDLHTAGYLAARKHHSGHGYELFADFDAWIKQDVLEKSSIRPLYEEWIQKGWLHVSPGAVFQPSLFVIRFDKLLQRGCQFQYFGYDPYQSKDPINTLKAYLQEKGVAQPDKYVLPVSQRNAWFNAPTDDLAKAIKSPIPYITFSANPMWPWLFGNCVLSIDGKAGAAVDMDLGNKKPVKRNPGSDSCKVDPIQCICVALGLMTEYEGKNH
jgi:phage terminase large subunit-like protein